MAYTVITLAGLCVSVAFLMVWSIARGLLNRRIRTVPVELRPVEELPAHLRQAFEGSIRQLNDLGFREQSCQLSQSIFGSDTAPTWALQFTNDQDHVMASIHPSNRPDLESHHVTFTSRDRECAQFLSFSWQSHLYVGGTPGFTFHDTQTTDVKEGLRLHLQNRSSIVPEPVIPDQATRLSDAQEFINRYVKFLFADGWTHQVSGGEYRFRVVPAFRLTIQLLIGEIRAKRSLRKERRQLPSTPSTTSPELEVDILKRFEAQVADPQPIHWAFKLGLFIGSAILFCIVFNLVLAVSWATVLLLAAAILFHELGHLVGMWLFGYRDLQIFFIPAFGAMTTGIKHEIRPWQKAVVVFLGPMPGLILSVVILLTLDLPAKSLWTEFFGIMLAINYINLLPIMPFDGGVLMHTAIAHRFPSVTSILTFTSTIVLGVAGVYLQDPVLVVLAVALAIVGRGQWILGKAEKALLSELQNAGNLDADSIMHRVFSELGKPQYKKVSFARKVRLARTVMNCVKNGKPSLALSWTCLGIQIGALAIPLVSAIAFLNK
jgi:Zn-dependent protease